MAWDLEFSLRMVDALQPYRVRWIEGCLPPDDYDGYAEFIRRAEGMAVATGEHEYTRWGFQELLSRKCCHIVQPDLSWCGGISEVRRIAALAGAYHVPVIPHAGGLQPWGIHWLTAQAATPLAEYRGHRLARGWGDAAIVPPCKACRSPRTAFSSRATCRGWAWRLTALLRVGRNLDNIHIRFSILSHVFQLLVPMA